jgi:5-methylcytosine-specific restriction endonuclease McrA
MFKPHVGICVCHGQKRWIVVKKGYCAQGNKERKGKRAPTKKKKKTTGERNFFLQIWEEREHKCQCCGTNLGDEPIVHFFSHLLPKSTHPELRLEKENIWLKCKDCHHEWEFGDKKQEKFKKAIEKREELKSYREWKP